MELKIESLIEDGRGGEGRGREGTGGDGTEREGRGGDGTDLF